MNRKHPINKKKILRCYIRIPPAKGGMENHIKTLTEHQRILGFDVDIAFNDGEKTNKNDIIIFKKIRLSNILISPLNFMVFYIALVIKLVLKRKKYDIIHIHGDWSSFIFTPLLRKVVKSEKVIFSMHETLRESFSHKLILPFVLKFSNLNITTGFECYNLIKDYNLCYFQPSGVDKIFFEQQSVIKFENRLKIITVAQFRPIKNLSMVVQIAQKLPQFYFTLVGDGIEFEKLKNEALIRKATNIIFTGKLTKAEIANLFSDHHLFLLTSLAEGTPTAVMEAMACGLPIVSSNAGGTESIIKDYENGFVIKDDFKDINSYVSNITKILQNEILWNKMKNNNTLKAKSFRWENVARNITKEMLNT